MKSLHIAAVDLVRGGLIVTYNDQTRAFYDESVLMAHLEAGQIPVRKRPQAVLRYEDRSGEKARA